MTYKLSKKAEKDFSDIYRYTFKKFGELQADKYTNSLESTFRLISENPKIGRSVDYVSKDLNRHEHMEHIIFYRIRKETIFIVRLLHESMDVSQHL